MQEPSVKEPPGRPEIEEAVAALARDLDAPSPDPAEIRRRIEALADMILEEAAPEPGPGSPGA